MRYLSALLVTRILRLMKMKPTTSWKEIERSLKKRKRGSAVRLEINPEKGSFLQDFLKQELDLVDEEIYEVRGPLDLTFLFGFISQRGWSPYASSPIRPKVPAELTPDLSLLTRSGTMIFCSITLMKVLILSSISSGMQPKIPRSLPSSRLCTVSAGIHPLSRPLPKQRKTASR